MKYWTLPAHLENTATHGAARDVLTFIDRREKETPIHWSEVYARARGAAGALAEHGVKPGDRVAIILPTCPEFIDALFGLQLLGATPVPLYPPVRLGRLTEYFDKTAAMLQAVSAAALMPRAAVPAPRATRGRAAPPPRRWRARRAGRGPSPSGSARG